MSELETPMHLDLRPDSSEPILRVSFSQLRQLRALRDPQSTAPDIEIETTPGRSKYFSIEELESIILLHD